MEIKSMSKWKVFNKFNSVFLFVLLLFGSCGVSSFGMEINDDINKNDIIDSSKEPETVFDDVGFSFYKSLGQPLNTFDHCFNFISKLLKFFGFLDLYKKRVKDPCKDSLLLALYKINVLGKNDKGSLVLYEKPFFNSEKTILNSVSRVLSSICYSFLPMKPFAVRTLQIQSTDVKLYNCCTDFHIDGIFGDFLGIFLGRCGLLCCDLSSFFPNFLGKNRLVLMMMSIRPLHIMLFLAQLFLSILKTYKIVNGNFKEIGVKEDGFDLISNVSFEYCCKLCILDIKIFEYFYIETPSIVLLALWLINHVW